MKRNSKGFTLIELLAAIVILGILLGISIPAISGMITNSTKKMYISDARKLISVAAYQMKAKSSVIEKPDDGDCILISMLYLDSSEFDDAPSGGTYEKESSYVVVKNNNGKLEYGATIVEKLKKGGYKGVELVKKTKLYTSSAVNHVMGFEATQVMNVDKDVTVGYINEKLGKNFLGSDGRITGIYNQRELIDNSSKYTSSSIPKIIRSSLLSAEPKYYNTLKAILQLTAKDDDTDPDKLSVYLSLEGYDDPNAIVVDYGESDMFSYTFDFTDDHDYDGSAIIIYVKVIDPEGNECKRDFTYLLHKNAAPDIDKSSSVTRRERDVYFGVPLNMLTAKVKLIVEDDIDATSDLQVCIRESDTKDAYNTCDEYHPIYNDGENGGIFSTDNTMEYLFHNCSKYANNKCRRDGTTHYLTIFVKDTYGAVSKKQFAYKFSINKIPEIKSLSIESNGYACRKPEECPIEKGASKKITVNVEATDDVDGPENLTVDISDGIGSAGYSYAYQPIGYTINGNYDGSVRTISIKVDDSEGGKSAIIPTEYLLYLNKKPVINSFSISSFGTACLNSPECPPEDGGSKEVYVYIDAEDDVDYDKLQVCFTIDKNVCNNYSYYKDYVNASKTYTMPHVYDGSSQTVWAYVRDSEYLFTSKAIAEPYRLYINKEPHLEFIEFNSKTGGRPITGSLHSIFKISGRDDVDTSKTLRFSIIEDGVVTLDHALLDNYINKNNEIKLAGAHDGRQRNIKVVLYDTDDGEDSLETTYDVYEGKPPTIEFYNVYSSGKPCANEQYCSGSGNGNYKAIYAVKASDDIDDENELQICVSEDENTCDDYKPYANYLENGAPKEKNYIFNTDSSTPYDGTLRTLYLHVKDSDQNVVKDSKTYKLYENKAPVITRDPTIIKNVADVNINYPDITYSIAAEDDLDEELQIRYCYKIGSGNETCTVYMNLEDSAVLNNENFFNLDRPNGETFTIYSRIKDSYGVETKSKELTYKVYTDIDPLIYQRNIVSGKRIYKNSNGDIVESLENIEDTSDYSEYTRLKIKFNVDDPYDKYSVCISSDGSTCNDYQGLYDGNNCIDSTCTNTRKSHSIEYDSPGFIEDGTHFELYLFVKDSHDAVSSIALFDETYNECLYTNDEDAIYDYEFDSELTNSEYNHTDPISMNKCAGKCYYYNHANATTNEIYAVYKSKITYTDKFNSSVTCNANNPEEHDYVASCDFKDCFYKNDSYVRNAIGTREVLDDEPWIAVVNENVYNCTGHYNLYLSSYNTGDKDITLTKVNTRICNTAIEEYAFDSSSPDPYVRISD